MSWIIEERLITLYPSLWPAVCPMDVYWERSMSWIIEEQFITLYPSLWPVVCPMDVYWDPKQQQKCRSLPFRCSLATSRVWTQAYLQRTNNHLHVTSQLCTPNALRMCASTVRRSSFTFAHVLFVFFNLVFSAPPQQMLTVSSTSSVGRCRKEVDL